MARLKGIGYPINKDIFLKKGTLLFMTTDENKFWIEASEERITEPRKGNRDPNDSSKLWIYRAKNSGST